MMCINKLKIKYLKLNSFERNLVTFSDIKSWIFKNRSIPKKIDFGLLRISPVDNISLVKDQFIPLTRNTIIRKLAQDQNEVSKLNQSLFEDFSRYLDACITNRNFFFLKEIKTSYEHLNPHVEVLSGGVKWTLSRRKMLDDEFWFMQKLCRLLDLANFREMNQKDLEKCLGKHIGYNSMQIWVDPNKYEMLKMWILGRENSSSMNGINKFINNYLPFFSFFQNPFKSGHIYRRVAVAVRVKKSDKIELKMFKDLSQGELIHTLPDVETYNSRFDNNMLIWTSALVAAGVSAHLMLPAATLESGWLLTSTHQLAISLAALSGGVGFINWHVIQQKKSNYWKWRSELNYRSIVANNRGVISLLGDRAQDEIFKECILAYVNILSHSNGISQKELESNLTSWAATNCSPEFEETAFNMEIDLTDALSLLRQLNIVSFDQETQLLTAKSLDNATVILGTEFNTSNLMLELDGNTVIRSDSSHLSASEPIAEGYEKINHVSKN